MNTIKTVIDGVEFSIMAQEVTGTLSYFNERWERVSDKEAVDAQGVIYNDTEAAYYRPRFTTVSKEADKFAAQGARYPHTEAVVMLTETLDVDQQTQRYRLRVAGKVGGVRVMDWEYCGEPFEWAWFNTTTMEAEALNAWAESGADAAMSKFKDRVEALSTAIYQYLNGVE